MHHGAGALPGEVAHRVERDLRVVGARLDAEVAADERGVELVARQRWQLGEAFGCRAARPKRWSNNDGPKPIVMVSFAGDRP